MSTKNELADWGEPPPDRSELAWARFLDSVLGSIERGKRVKAGELLHGEPEVIDAGERLIEGVVSLFECAASVIEHSSLPDAGVVRPHDAAGEFVLTQIANQAERAASGAGDLADHGVNPRLIDVDDSDGGTFAGEAERAGPPHPGSRCCDDADLVVEPHLCSLPPHRGATPQAAMSLLS